jgi:signal transduction histidine kinase
LSLRGQESWLTGGFWTSDLLSEEGHFQEHSVVVLRGSDHGIVYSDDCPVLLTDQRDAYLAGPAQSGRSQQQAGAFEYEEYGGERVGAFFRLPDEEWIVVASSMPAGVLAPVGKLVGIYWLFVLGLAISTSLGFSILIGRFTRSLRELARAAEEIGLGELDPWLPLQTSGELGQLTVAFSRMLDRIRHMMTKVDQSGRLAVVGQLSAYLAHEIRNPLSSIKMNLQRLLRWTKAGRVPDFCLEPLEISLREVERLSGSVSGVLELSRSQDGDREIISLHDILGDAADLLSDRFKRQGVELKLDLDAEADLALARTGQVKSAILNLMVNALEAQPGGGRLEIRSTLSHSPELRLPLVALHFKDSGTGVPPDIRDHVFEPFFTTKPGGSGIGLAMAAQAIRDNGGELYLEPSPLDDSGAEFVVVFPLPALASNIEPLPEGTVRVAAEAVRRWSAEPRRTDKEAPRKGKVPEHLMTPEGLKAALASPPPSSEDVS